MTAKLIRYIGFSLYKRLEITVLRVWKTRGFHFAKFVSTLSDPDTPVCYIYKLL